MAYHLSKRGVEKEKKKIPYTKFCFVLFRGVFFGWGFPPYSTVILQFGPIPHYHMRVEYANRTSEIEFFRQITALLIIFEGTVQYIHPHYDLPKYKTCYLRAVREKNLLLLFSMDTVLVYEEFCM